MKSLFNVSLSYSRTNETAGDTGDMFVVKRNCVVISMLTFGVKTSAFVE